jgi:Mg2+-importing ATPase
MQVSAQIQKDEQRSLDQPHGLTADEATLRLAQFGPNDPTSKRARPQWLDLLILLTNPLTLILLIAAGISAAIGQRIDAYLIAGMVLIGTGIDFLQTYRSRNIIERLRATVASTASVNRDGRWLEIPRRTVVPGDLIHLAAGDSSLQMPNFGNPGISTFSRPR